MSARRRSEVFQENASGLNVMVKLVWDPAGRMTGSAEIYRSVEKLWKFEFAIAQDDRPLRGDWAESLRSQLPRLAKDAPVETKKFGPEQYFTARLTRSATSWALAIEGGHAQIAQLTAGLQPGLNEGDLDLLIVDQLGSWGLIMEPEPEEPTDEG